MVHFVCYVDKDTLLERENDDTKCKHFWIYDPLFRNTSFEGSLTEAVSTCAHSGSNDKCCVPFRVEILGAYFTFRLMAYIICELSLT
jgi:hypothetical protein